METFNPLTETNSSQEAKEGREYTIVEDGSGGKYKVINLNWEGWAPKEGIIEITPMRFAKGLGNAIRHQSNPTFSRIPDKKTGIIIGIPNGFQGGAGDRRIIWKNISVKGAEFLDLSDKTQRERWICIKNGPFLKGSPNFIASSKTVYEAIDKEREAIEFKKSRRVKQKASEIAGSLVGEELKDMALMLGFDPKTMSEDSLWMTVVKFAEDSVKDRQTGKTGAEKFLEVYNSDTKVEHVILKRAMSTGVVTETLEKYINFNGMTLGYNEQEAVRFLKDNPATKGAIDVLSRKKQDGSTQVHEAPAKVAVKDEKDAVIERLKAELEAERNATRELTSIVSEEKGLDILKTEDPEYATLLAEAKQLDIKGAHMIGKSKSGEERNAALRAKIEEVKQSTKN